MCEEWRERGREREGGGADREKLVLGLCGFVNRTGSPQDNEAPSFFSCPKRERDVVVVVVVVVVGGGGEGRREERERRGRGLNTQNQKEVHRHSD